MAINLKKEEVQTEKKEVRFLCNYCGLHKPMREKVELQQGTFCKECVAECNGICTNSPKVMLTLEKLVDRPISAELKRKLFLIENNLYSILYKIKYQNFLLHKKCAQLDSELLMEIRNAFERLTEYAECSDYTVEGEVPEFAQSNIPGHQYINGNLYKVLDKSYY